MTRHGKAVDRSEEWAALRARYLDESGNRPPSSARGLHHLALLSSDVEATINFYQGLLGPDGERLELSSDLLLEMYGTTVA